MTEVDWILLVPVACCAAAVVFDLRSRLIPDTISVGLLAGGIAAALLKWHGLPWTGALAGAAIGFAAVLPFTLADGIGGGDLKLVAGLGSWLGIAGTFSLLFWSAMAGMLAAFAAQARGRKDFPFAPAIFAGLLIAVFLPDALPSLIAWLRG